MQKSDRNSRPFLLIVVVSALLAIPAAALDDGPVSRVRYTEVREHVVERRVELPGTVEAPYSALVASEVEGVVAKRLAREGQHVKKGGPLVELRTSHLELDLERATADLREAEARLALARTQRDRSEELYQEGVLSRQQFDDARYEFEAWRGRAERLEAEIARIRLDLERSVVRAPFGGVVVREAVEVGEWVAKGATVMELMSPYVLEVRVDVPERHYDEVRPGARAFVRFEALGGVELEGRVTSLVPKANANARTFPLKIRVENPEGRIGAGMLAEVRLEASDKRRARIVPKDAVVSRGENHFVYLLDGEPLVNGEQSVKVKMVPVETGLAVGQWVEVDGPVATNAKVVTRGNERIRPGQKVVAEAISYPAP